MEGRKACSSSRKPLECLYIWAQLIQSKAIILQQAWKQVVPVTSTRCATECFCVKPAISPGPYRCFAFADLNPLGLAGSILHHLNLEDRRGESLSPVKGFLRCSGPFYPSSSALPKHFPCATIRKRLVRFIRWISCAPPPALGDKTTSVWSLHIDWGGQGVVLPCRYYWRTTNHAWLGPSQPSKSQ